MSEQNLKIADWKSIRETIIAKKYLSLSVQEYVDSFIDNNHKKIRLPSYQRSAVWKEEQIGLLWDSMLKGFSIGSLMFSTPDPEKRQTSREQDSTENRVPIEDDFFHLIDGQQRHNAIRIGLGKNPDKFKLWIDLGVKNSDRAILNEKIFHVCSESLPFGHITPPSPQKVSEILWKIKDVKKQDIRTGDVIGDVRITWKTIDQGDSDITDYTYPFAAIAPVYFADLFREYLSTDCKELNCAECSKNCSLKNYVDKAFQENSQMTGSVPEVKPLEVFSQSYVASRMRNIKEYNIPVSLVENIYNEETMFKIFQRLNRMGTVPSEGDMFYSWLKFKIPQCHSAVEKVFIDSGKFLDETEIVHDAVRLCFKNSDRDYPRLKYNLYDNIIKKDKEFVANLNALLSQEHNLMGTYLKSIRKCISYNSDQNNDIGIPVTMISQLHWRVWHTLSLFVHKFHGALEQGQNQEVNRLEMIRYIFLDRLFGDSSEAFITLPFKIVSEKESPVFPGEAIFRGLIERELIDKSKWKRFLAQELTGNAPDMIGDVEYCENLTDILMYSQRKWIARWFDNYDPVRHDRKESLPYDWDHIVPSNMFNFKGGRRNITNLLGDEKEIFGEYRNKYSSSIGNLRLWDRSLNRGDKDSTLQYKHLLSISGDDINSEIVEEDNYLNKIYKILDLNTLEDIKDATNYFHPLDWENTPASETFRESNNDEPTKRRKYWTKSGLDNFRDAVLKRRKEIIHSFIHDLKLNEWEICD